jgi:hypothetical protein
MTVHDQLRYGPLAGAVSLRQDIADRVDRAYRNARRMRAVIVTTGAVVSLGQLACRFDLLSMSGWVNERTCGVSFAVITATLLASALVWSCRERMEVNRTRLSSYLSRLPVQFMD